MSKLNSIIISFFIIVALLLLGIHRIVESEGFATLISKRVSDKIKEKIEYELAFKKMEVVFFPPSTIFHDVSLKKKGLVEVQGSQVGFKLGLADLLSNKLSFEKIFIRDASAR